MKNYTKRKIVDLTHTQYHDVKRISKKMKISGSEYIRRRIPSWAEMLKELHEDQKHAQYITKKNLLK